jgi:hypothetical protein
MTEPTTSRASAIVGRAGRAVRAAGPTIAEIVTSVGASLLMLAWSTTIKVDPLNRVGQVSGMAALQLRFALIGVVIVAGMLVAYRWGGPLAKLLTARLGCAAFAGITTGLVAGGMFMALRGTPWGLWAGGGDYTPLLRWAYDVKAGASIPAYYPPLFTYLIGDYSALTGLAPEYAIKHLQIFFTAMYGPATYLAWRLNLRPAWALGVGGLAMLPFLEPVKPYEQIVLVVLVPVLIAVVRRLRRAGELSTAGAVRIGVGYGAGLGVMFLLYSGWFVWFAPGVVLAAVLLGPWRRSARPALLFTATTTLVFLAVAWMHLRGLLEARGALSDDFFYFDTCTNPTYIAMWANDRPFLLGSVWPPLGELGGVGVFTLLLAGGALLAIGLGWRRTPVAVAGLAIVGAWLIRMWLASQMFDTSTVRLYPRTTIAILYALLALAGYGLFYLVSSWRARPSAPLGLLVIPLAFVLASGASATVDKYLPSPHQDSTGWFAWIAQAKPSLTGVCSKYATVHGCVWGRPLTLLRVPSAPPTCRAPKGDNQPAVSEPAVLRRARLLDVGR